MEVLIDSEQFESSWSQSRSRASPPSTWFRFSLLLSTMRAPGQASPPCSAFAVVGIRVTVADRNEEERQW
uniref:Uncharacterized protein n=1 Tax=Brassica campestris TaxID=3711 RepID=M4F937_BRACM